MENCNVKTLNGGGNSNLLKFGEIRFMLNQASIRTRWNVQFSSPVTIEIIGSGKFYTSQGVEIGNKVENFQETRIYINNTTEGDLFVISDKYAIEEFSSPDGGMLISPDYIPQLTYLSSIVTFSPFRENIPFDIERLCTGSLSIATIYSIYNHYAEGSIEKAVEALLSFGRSSGTLQINGYDTKITLHGELFFTVFADRAEYLTVTFGNNSATLTWKGNTIASYDGTTWTYSS